MVAKGSRETEGEWRTREEGKKILVGINMTHNVILLNVLALNFKLGKFLFEI